MVDVFDKISDTVVECLITDNTSLFSSDLSTDNFQITDQQVQCLAVSVM